VLSIPGRTGLGNFASIYEIVRKTNTNDRILIVAFKGTSPLDLNQWLVDISIAKTNAADHLYGNIHQGFFNSMFRAGPDTTNTLYLEVVKYTNKMIAEEKAKEKDISFRLWVTGHSLGAALATLFFSRVVKSKSNSDIRGATIEGAYTYGGPRVGNLDFHCQFTSRSNMPYDNRSRLHRVFNVNDPVSTVPFGHDNPDVLSVITRSAGALNYIHVGTPVPIHRHPFYCIPGTYPDFVVSSFSDLCIYFYRCTLVALSVTHILDYFMQWAVFFERYSFQNNCLWFDVLARFTLCNDHLPSTYLRNLLEYERTHPVRENDPKPMTMTISD